MPRTAATSTTATVPRACSACWRPVSPCCSGSWCSWPSRATTRRGRERRPRRGIVAQQVETAQLFRPTVAGELTAELVCYAAVGRRRAVGAHGGWHPRRGAQPVGRRDCSRRCCTDRARRRPREEAAYSKWLDQTVGPRGGAQRPDPRRRRCDPHAAVGGAVLQRRCHLRLHAVLRRRGERAVVQALLMGTVVSVDRHAAAPAAVPRQPLPRRASAACDRWRWSERCSSSTRSWRSPATTSPYRVTPAVTRCRGWKWSG